MFIGAPSLGYVADRYGRWSSLLLSTGIICYFGILSAASPSYPWMLLTRGTVGFSIGGLVASSSTLTAEFMPAKYRAKGIILMIAFWTLGGLFEVLIAMLVLPRLGWRWLLVLTATPLIATLPAFLWLPRSPRFLIASGKPEAALEVINRVARINGKPELTQPIKSTGKAERGNIKAIFHGWRYSITSILLFFIWFVCGFIYYGAVLLSSEILRYPHRCLQDRSQMSEIDSRRLDPSCCHTFTQEDYNSMLIATAGEILNLLWNFLLLDCIGRKFTLLFNLMCSGLFFILLDLCIPVTGTNVFLFFLRSFTNAAFVTSYVYTTEVYPTQIRTLAGGLCSSMSRVGAMSTPFVAQVLIPDYSVLVALLVYMSVSVAGGIASAVLPIETRGRGLLQTVEDESEDIELREQLEVANSSGYSTFDKKDT